MHLSLINPHIRLARESKIRAGHNIARRVIYDYELIYLERGAFTLIYDDIPYSCAEGELIFIRPGIPHSFIFDKGDISQPHIHFDMTYRAQSEIIPISFKDITEMTETEKEWIHRDYLASYPKTPFVSVNDKRPFLKNFYRIISGTDSDLDKKALMLKLISSIMSDNFDNAIEEQDDFGIERQIKDYIDAGNGLCMSLDEFADTFFYSKFYLEKRFKKCFNVGIIEYRNNKRMALARELLKTNSVSKTADSLGFKSIYSFSRAYKLHYGHSPSQK